MVQSYFRFVLVVRSRRLCLRSLLAYQGERLASSDENDGDGLEVEEADEHGLLTSLTLAR